MNKTDALLTLLELSELDFTIMKSEQLRDWLGALRFITRQVEHELLQRDSEHRFYSIRN